MKIVKNLVFMFSLAILQPLQAGWLETMLGTNIAKHFVARRPALAVAGTVAATLALSRMYLELQFNQLEQAQECIEAIKRSPTVGLDMAQQRLKKDWLDQAVYNRLMALLTELKTPSLYEGESSVPELRESLYIMEINIICRKSILQGYQDDLNRAAVWAGLIGATYMLIKR